jgi:hypothetical protein
MTGPLKRRLDMSQTITEMLTVAIAARKDSLKALRSRIAEILDPIPVGVVLSDEAGEVCKIVRICTGASQWSNRSWELTIKGTGAIVAGSRDGGVAGAMPDSYKLLCEIDLDSSLFDGNNMHHRTDEPTCLYTGANLWDEGDSSLFDGNNMHHRTDEPTCLYTGANLWDEGYPQALGYLSGPETRACARRLPTAIERYIRKCESERAENSKTLTA